MSPLGGVKVENKPASCWERVFPVLGLVAELRPVRRAWMTWNEVRVAFSACLSVMIALRIGDLMIGLVRAAIRAHRHGPMCAIFRGPLRTRYENHLELPLWYPYILTRTLLFQCRTDIRPEMESFFLAANPFRFLFRIWMTFTLGHRGNLTGGIARLLKIVVTCKV